MKFSHFFINRPIFAGVISIVIFLLGLGAYLALPVAQYPNVAPPSVYVGASYRGASPEVVMKSVVAPLEQALNGVEGMLYMQSQSGSDGSAQIVITFETGTNIDMAQVRVQNRVSETLSRLPQEVRDTGVTVRKRSPDLLIWINLFSPNGTRDKLYLTNYALTQMQDRLARIYGISEFGVWGAKEYCMRIWLDPDRLSALDVTPQQVIDALQEQNKQIAAGKLNAPPLDSDAAFEMIINTQGRLETEREFGGIIIKYLPDGRIIYLRDVARIELGSYTYGNESYINNKSAVTMGAYQLPNANAMELSKKVRAELEEMKKSFPPDVDYVIGYDATEFIQESINAVYRTIFEAILLVVVVVLLFLQNWRAAIIPLFAIPVSLVGTFAVMYLFGFSINNLTLFGLVLAIGIVVDDAIVVVENVERNMRLGLPVREATEKAMTQVQGAVIAIALVLSCVFVPTAFVGGISGEFYKQFALTIAASTILSALVSLTLTPALCALLLRDISQKSTGFASKLWNYTIGGFFWLFNKGFTWVSEKYGWFVAKLTRVSILVLALYAGLLWATKYTFEETPKGFIPKQDQGYFSATIILPDGASFERTEEVVKRAGQLIMQVEGVKYTNAVAGRNGISGMASSNAGNITINLSDRKERDKNGRSAGVILDEVRAILDEACPEGAVYMMTPAPVRGIGSGSDFKMQLQDRAGYGIDELNKQLAIMVDEINKLDCVSQAFTGFRISNPQLYVDIDRERAQKLNVPLESIFTTLQYNLGSIYVNDFNILGRVYRVVAQAESSNRKDLRDIYNLKVPDANGKYVPLGSLISIDRIIGPDRTVRYNMYESAEIQGNLSKGYSSGEAIHAIDELALQVLPQGMGIEWTDIAFQQKRTGNTSLIVFFVCVVFVFLMLAALYESWTIPLAVILIVPLVLFFAISGIHARGLDNNILTQIGFIVLIGLACKNAILIVEFAKQREENGEELVSSVSNASKNRLRPIVMTSMAFILGVFPLAYGTGSGFELRQSLGTSVFFGMIGVTIAGCVFTPIFYYVIRRLFGKPILDRK
ncbi:MAG: hydrophobe/amphiphile efflux-1 family RND transporter [Verrucomicrobia bacterium]|nr:MAG: hydrophobe/amphiphile efflux-1 family RND transporter [Verrucomicrobiota bacterium]